MPGESESSVQPVKLLGRDEMNLAEFPIALLANRAGSSALTFHKDRILTLPDGTLLHQEWTVTGTPEYGLPQHSDEDVLLGLLKIASDHDFTSPTVHFTRRGLLTLIGWANDGRNHKRLEHALRRLATTRIVAKNAFWDNRHKVYETLVFGIIETLRLFERVPGAASTYELAYSANWARFSQEFFTSMQAGYIKPLNLGLYFSLQSAIAKRLMRFLDKKGYQKERFEIGLLQLASTHIGLSDSKCAFPSWIKQKLEPAHAELIEAGFLKSAAFKRTREGDWKVSYEFQRGLSAARASEPAVLSDLTRRGVALRTARQLLDDKGEAHIRAQLDVFDYLYRLAPRDALRNPAGFLVRAIREEWPLNPPGYVSPAERERQAEEKSRVSLERERQENEARSTEERILAVLSALPAGDAQALRREAMDQVRQQIGPAIKLQSDSPVVEAFLAAIVQERFPDRFKT